MGSQTSRLLLLSLVVLATLAIAEWLFQAGQGADGTPVAQGSAPVMAIPVPRFTLAERETFSETLTRPLFMPDRQPPGTAGSEASEPVQRAAKPDPKRYALSAVIIVDDERVALLTDTATGGLSRVKEGESVAGWKVDEIREESAVLSSGDNRAELRLRTFEAPAPVPRSRKTAAGAKRKPQATSTDKASKDVIRKRPRRPKREPVQE